LVFSYAVIYNSKYDDNNDGNIFESSYNTKAAAISSSPYASSPSHSSTKVRQNYYYNEYHEGIIEIASSFLKILSKEVVDKTMVAAAVKENEVKAKLLAGYSTPSMQEDS
jgi:hypothetical protein